MLIGPETDFHFPKRSELTVPNRFDIRFDATEMGVRQTLTSLLSFLTEIGIGEMNRGTVEIVLAEALNNVVEHAYAETGQGSIELQCKSQVDRLDVAIMDQGPPVPVHVFAERSAPDTDVPLDDLPEGGFGWLLIQNMTENLAYHRVGDTNCLRMAIPLT
ncbi:MAG: ATPase [Rhodobacteraceae bacterium]|nr:ATPase [Paracoccaceae bacterium]MBT27209.1 ATPase [Paracoccaceae bacterium]|tara:strand:- start:291 stop:770 length:480 start_codon:yes stop_codon:yes gene_type:complete